MKEVDKILIGIIIGLVMTFIITVVISNDYNKSKDNREIIKNDQIYYSAIDIEHNIVIDSLIFIEDKRDYWFLKRKEKMYYLGKCTFYLKN